MKRILITGSNGLLGQKLIHLIRQQGGWDLWATSKGDNRIDSLNDLQYEAADMEVPGELSSLVHALKPNVVINTAAVTNVDKCETEKELCRRVNVDAVKELCEACKEIDAHLIHLSTDFVFDGENGPYSEEDEPAPLSYYGQSKLDSEEVVKNAGLSKWAIARTIIVYGTAENLSRSNIVLWARESMLSEKPLRIVNDQFRAPTLAEDLATGCLLIAEKEATGIFHLSGKDIMSIYELVCRVGKFYDKQVDHVEEITSDTLNQAAKRPPRTGFILDKASDVLGYAPHSFEEGLEIVEQQLSKIS